MLSESRIVADYTDRADFLMGKSETFAPAGVLLGCFFNISVEIVHHPAGEVRKPRQR